MAAAAMEVTDRGGGLVAIVALADPSGQYELALAVSAISLALKRVKAAEAITGYANGGSGHAMRHLDDAFTAMTTHRRDITEAQEHRAFEAANAARSGR